MTLTWTLAAMAFEQTERVPVAALVPVLKQIQEIFPPVKQRQNVSSLGN